MLRVSIKQCMDIFGPQFNETEIMSGITSTNTNYGGKKIAGTKVTNFIFTTKKLYFSVVDINNIKYLIELVQD